MSDPSLDGELKRLLPDPVLRIELQDYVRNVVDAAVEELADDAFSPSSPEPTADTLAARVAHYDAVLHPPCRMLVIGAFYSDVPAHHRLWTDVIERLADLAVAVDRESGTKFTAWTQLAWLPALAALYACAFGSLAGQHPETLAAVIAQLREMRAEDWKESHLQRIGLDAVGIAASQLYSDAKTPQAEFMLERLRTFAAGIVRADRVDDVYDQVEYTIGLNRADQTLGADLGGRVLPDFVRLLWRRDTWFDESGNFGGLPRWVEGTNAKSWLAAGLFSSDPERIAAVRERYESALRDYASRQSFSWR